MEYLTTHLKTASSTYGVIISDIARWPEKEQPDMRYFNTLIPVAPEIVPEKLTAAQTLRVRITQAKAMATQPISKDSADKARRRPQTPLMLTPTVAWRKLCAKTGCGITIQTFYRWIGNGNIYSVRLGKRIFVPIVVLDELIEKCFAGEDLKSAPE